jgi:oligosaccharide repeat unit polymerase
LQIARKVPAIFLLIYAVLFIVYFIELSNIQILTFTFYFLSVLFLWLYIRISGNRVDSVLAFYITFVMSIGLGAIGFTVNENLLLHTVVGGSQLGDILDWYSFCMSLGLWLFICSAFLLRSIKPSLIVRPNRIPQNTRKSVSLAFYSITFIALYGILMEPGYLSLLRELLAGGVSGGFIRKSITLSDSANTFSGKGLVTFIKYQLFPFITLAMLVNYRHNKVMLSAIVIFSLVLLATDFRRGPLLFHAVGLLVLYITFSRDYKKAGYFAYVLPVISIVLLMITMTIFLGRSQGVNSSVFVLELLFRVFVSQSQTGTYVFQLIPSIQPYLEGFGYIQNLPSFITGMDSSSYASEVFYYIHGREGGASFSAFTEAYANFGIFGIIVIPILLALVMLSIELRRTKMAHDNLELCFYIYCLVSIVPNLALGSAVGPLINFLFLRLLIFLIRTSSILLSSGSSRKASVMIGERH